MGPGTLVSGPSFFYPVLHVFCVLAAFFAFILVVFTFSLCFLCDKLLILFALLKINMLF